MTDPVTPPEMEPVSYEEYRADPDTGATVLVHAETHFVEVPPPTHPDRMLARIKQLTTAQRDLVAAAEAALDPTATRATKDAALARIRALKGRT